MNYEMQKFRSSGRKTPLSSKCFAQPDRKFLHFVIQEKVRKSESYKVEIPAITIEI